MSTTTAATQSSGFVTWILANGQIIAFFAQILYWILIVLFLGYAVFQFKRWVNYQLGTGRSGKLRTDDSGAKTESTAPVAVEEFVE